MPKEYIEYQNAITSADDLNKQGRKSDVLVSALNKCEKLEKQLKIAVNLLEAISFQINVYLEEPNARQNFSNSRLWQFQRPLKEALKQIKELNNENSN